MARAWCIATALGALALVATRASGAARELWIRSTPWPAPWSFTAEELAAALRLRLPSVVVRVTPGGPDDAAKPVLEGVVGDPPRLRLVRAREVLLDAPLSPIGEESSRRAALYAAIALDTAGEPAPVAESARTVAPAIARAATPAVAAPRWSLAASVGPALALDDDEAAGIAPALLVRLRVPLAAELSLELGGKLSGSYGPEVDVDLSIVDRAVWVGASYRIGWPRVAVDLGLAAQYTSPSVDVDGVTAPVVSPGASRFGARASASLSYAVVPRLAVVAGVAATFALADREFTAGGQDLAGLGAVMLDVSVGPEVRW